MSRSVALALLMACGCSPVLDLGENGDYSGQRALALGGDTSCASRGDRVACWGRADRGQIGRAPALAHDDCGGVACDRTPVNGALPALTALSLGERHACASRADRRVVCWGDNTYGQLGRGLSDADPHGTPVSLALDEVTLLAAGGEHSCAVAAGRLWCWGRGAEGQLGVDPALLERCAAPGGGGGESVPCATAPRAVELPGEVASLALGATTTCVLDGEGGLHCFGDNAHGQAGVGSEALQVATPTRLPLERVTHVAVGRHHACAVLRAGTVQCWGSHAAGQLGVGTAPLGNCAGEPCARSPVPVSDLDAALEVVTGDEHTCALQEGGAVSCWGSDALEQLGNSDEGVGACAGTASSFPCASRPTTPHGLRPVSALASGAAHVCALDATRVLCWGDNRRGQSAQWRPDTITFGLEVYGLWP